MLGVDESHPIDVREPESEALSAIASPNLTGLVYEIRVSG